jgi:hypothetical protein
MVYKDYIRCVKLSEINNTVIENDLFRFLYDVRKNIRKETHRSDYIEGDGSKVETYYHGEMLIFYKIVNNVHTGHDFYDTIHGMYLEMYGRNKKTLHGANRSFFNFYEEYAKKEFKIISI